MSSRRMTGWGHSPYLGKKKIWSSVRLAPLTRCSNTFRTESLTGSERAVGQAQWFQVASSGRGTQDTARSAVCPRRSPLQLSF